MIAIQAAIDSHTKRKFASYLFWQGWTLANISEYLEVPLPTVSSWKSRDEWESTKTFKRVESVLEFKLIQLIMKDKKNGGDYKEIDLLMRQVEKTTRINKYDETGKESDLNLSLKRGYEKRSQNKSDKNVVTDEVKEKLKEYFFDNMFSYQRKWYEAGLIHRIRNLLKSRQVGATFFFANEAGYDAVTTLRDQIFLSASKAQAFVFKEYIKKMYMEAANIELTGDPIILNVNGTQVPLRFLGTNSNTAQSYHGNLYLDEYFWIPQFLRLRKVASGMAMHKKWRQTYFSTPSAMSHDAFPFWSGELFNKGREKDQRIKLDVSHANLKDGRLCADGQWRHILTVEDAVAGGCDLFDINQLRLEYSPDEYNNLLMCQFIDDTNSLFPLQTLQKCMVDSWESWEDYKPFAQRPMANHPVWIGYDPARSGDSAGIVIVAPPLKNGGKFRMIEKKQFVGVSYAEQAEWIKQATIRFNVQYIGIDTNGVGYPVYELVKQFFPMATPLLYSPESKGRMVLKAQNVINKNRLEFDSGWNDVCAAMMGIRRVLTPSGNNITYTSGRNADGHADIAWALLHVLINEPFEVDADEHIGSESTMIIF